MTSRSRSHSKQCNNRAFTQFALVVIVVIVCIISGNVYTNLKLTAISNGSGERYSFRSLNKTTYFVSVCSESFDGRRLGNQLFNFAAMVYVAKRTNHRLAMIRQHPYGWIDRWFDVPEDVLARFDDIYGALCPNCWYVGESMGGLSYDPTVATLLQNRINFTVQNLLVCGWFQSWRYIIGLEDLLRHQLLRPHANLSAQVNRFFHDARPCRWNHTERHLRVGIHVRVGDIASSDKFAFGYTIPTREYFVQAMGNIIDDASLRPANATTDSFDGCSKSTATVPDTEQSGLPNYRPIQFIVASDSVDWCKDKLNLQSVVDELLKQRREQNSSIADLIDVEVTYSIDHSEGFDLVMLSSCDAVIMTTGTYGWWAAWLAEGQNSKRTIYYSNWPRPESYLAMIVSKNDFYPPHWISFDAPYVNF